MTTLLMLVRSAITGIPLSRDALKGLSDEAWGNLLREAERQSVTGLLYHALSLMQDSVSIPEAVSYPLLTRAVQIETATREMMDASRDLTGLLGQYGLHPMEMKGGAVAALYPKPGLREYGDIDLYFPQEEARKTAEVIREHASGVTVAPDGSIHFRYRDLEIDGHFAYFDLSLHGDLPPVPSPEATLLMLSTHLLKHAMGAGAGLRHVCDMAASSVIILSPVQKRLPATACAARLIRPGASCGIFPSPCAMLRARRCRQS